MRQAIETKFIRPTCYKGSRVKARCLAGSITLHWDHALNRDENHQKATKMLAEKLKWHGKWIGGSSMSNPKGYVFVVTIGEYDFLIEKQNEP